MRPYSDFFGAVNSTKNDIFLRVLRFLVFAEVGVLVVGFRKLLSLGIFYHRVPRVNGGGAVVSLWAEACH
ncbi:hypothetical protein [Sulfidibacter corallicola]|uniref:Uncharacterized protein n=1 Tax=Sulfidibacter corallicola TaxID=2818388 RepID=A0A8A4TML8_SULCO|nr:hypothetical protein [Sulfidibacter corallicola]QTD50131.1 hypothetical protein J3U87_31490 [Sulfidibacter corallicola]